MNIDEILTLVQAVSDSKLTSFKLDQGDMHISLKKEKEEAKIITVSAPGAVAAVPASTAAPVLTAASTSVSTEIPAAAPEAAEHHDIASDKVITSPLVGTFYSSSSPDAESFVKEGDTVKKGQVLGIIEAMKLMNEIESEYDGVIEAILVNNEEVVEYGQPLFRIKEIQEIIPHRHPFLLVDCIEELEPGVKAVGYKSVTYDEPYFRGHFPQEPVMPGVLIVEALAQTGAVAILSQENFKGKTAYFGGLNNVKFKHKVVPGDRLRLECEIIKQKGPVGVGKATATVDGKIAVVGELTFMIG